MSARRKFGKICLSAIYCAFFLIFAFPKIVFAQVVINEFLPNPSFGDDWIELYNLEDNEVDISNWGVEDSTSKMKTFDSGTRISGKGFFNFSVGSRLNKNGDTIKLVDESGQIKDETSYSFDPGTDVSMGRCPDGSGSFSSLSSTTPGSTNNCPIDTPTPTSTPTDTPTTTPTPTSVSNPTSTSTPTKTPTKTPTNTPTPTPVKGSYKINDVKDEDGNVLSSVKIYVNDVYIHHYAPEELKFCEGCYCDDDKLVSCGFGEHTVRLEKSGYQDWNKTIDIFAGDAEEVNPVMSEVSSSTPTSTPTPTSVPTATAKLTASAVTATVKPTPSPTKKIADLGEELATESSMATIAGEATESAELISPLATASSNLGRILGGGLFSLSGLAFLAGGAVPLIRRIKKMKKIF